MNLFALLMAFLLISPQAQRNPAGEFTAVTRFDPARNASRDLQAAEAEAAKTGRRVLVDVGGDWCIWCRRLDSFFQENKDIDAFRQQHFVTVKINYSKENRNEEVLSRFPKVAGYPHLFVLGPDGTLLHSQDTGALESGKGHDRAKVLAFLKAWAPPRSP